MTFGEHSHENVRFPRRAVCCAAGPHGLVGPRRSTWLGRARAASSAGLPAVPRRPKSSSWSTPSPAGGKVLRLGRTLSTGGRPLGAGGRKIRPGWNSIRKSFLAEKGYKRGASGLLYISAERFPAFQSHTFYWFSQIQGVLGAIFHSKTVLMREKRVVFWSIVFLPCIEGAYIP